LSFSLVLESSKTKGNNREINSAKGSITFFNMTSATNQAVGPQPSRAEQETQNEARRLTSQIEAALAVVGTRSPEQSDELDVSADRIERAARDLVDALRELADERKEQQDEQ
jgi:hypothetical protein